MSSRVSPKNTTGISLFNTSVGGANIKGFQNINFTDLLGKLANPSCSHNHLIDQQQIDYNVFREFYWTVERPL